MLPSFLGNTHLCQGKQKSIPRTAEVFHSIPNRRIVAPKPLVSEPAMAVSCSQFSIQPGFLIPEENPLAHQNVQAVHAYKFQVVLPG